MAGGYGMRDGSAIINAVQGYADSKEREKNRIEDNAIRLEEKNYRRGIDQRNWDVAEDERVRISTERKNVSDTSGAYMQSAIDGYGSAAEVVARGASGEGVGTQPEVAPNEDGSVGLNITTKDGQKRAITENASDNKSKPLKFDPNTIEETQAAVEKTYRFYMDNGGKPEEANAYVRASMYTDPMSGLTVPTPDAETFQRRLKENGIGLKDKHIHEPNIRGTAAKFDERVGEVVGAGVDKIKDAHAASNANAKERGIRADKIVDEKGIVGLTKQNLSDDAEYIKGVGSDVYKWLKSVDKAITEPIGKKLFGKGFTYGDAGKPTTVKASTVGKDESLQIGQQLADKNQKIIDDGGEPPTTSTETTKMLSTSTTYDGQVNNMAVDVKGRKKQAQLYMEAVIARAPGYEINGVKNIMETGDPRYSSKDMADLALDTKVKESTIVRNISSANAAIARANKSNKPEDLYKAHTEGRRVITPLLEGLADKLAGGKSEFSKPLKGRFLLGYNDVITSNGFDPNELTNPKFMKTVTDGLEKFYWDTKDGDYSGASAAAWVNTAAGKLKSHTAFRITQLSASRQIGAAPLTRAVSNEIDIRSEEKGSELTEAEIDEIFEELEGSIQAK